MHRGSASLVAVLGLTSCIAAPYRADVARALGTVTDASAMAHVEALTAIGPRPESDRDATERTLRYLEERLRAWGYTTAREPFHALMRDYRRIERDGEASWVMTTKRGVLHHNLVAEREGSTRPEVVIEVGAHYDSMPWAPGADDNASGVAVALEVARACAGFELGKTVRFVFFAMEEEGLVGSAAHVEALGDDRARIEGALIMDMVGFATDEPGSQDAPIRIPLIASLPYEGNFVIDAGNFGSGWIGNLFEGCIETYVPELPYFSVNRLAGWFDDAMRSDHASYWRAGIDAILLNDTAEFRNPHYHKPGDTAATLSPTFLRRVAQAVLATVLVWAEATPGADPD